MIILVLLSFASRSHQPVEQGPSKHESTQTAKHVANPEIAQRPVKVFPRLTFGLQCEQQHRNDRGGDKVEDEAGVGFEAQCASGDAKERGGQVANVRCHLGGVSMWLMTAGRVLGWAWKDGGGKQRTWVLCCTLVATMGLI